MSGLYHSFIYQPLYNGLIFLIGSFPLVDAGVAVIFFTIIIKIALFPLSKKFIKAQIVMKEIQPEVDAIKTKYKDQKQEQAKKIMEVYKSRNINPFSGVLLIFIQLPILFALYRVFSSGLPLIKTIDLYSFVTEPTHINMMFLGFFDIASKKNIILSILVAVSQFFQARFMTSGFGVGNTPKTDEKGAKGSFSGDFARSMSIQTQYVLPIFIGVISYGLSGALAIYWITSNLFAIGQEVYMRRVRNTSK